MQEERKLMMAKQDAKQLTDAANADSPTSRYAQAKIAALRIALKENGLMFGGTKSIGDACHSLSHISGQATGFEMFARGRCEETYLLTEYGRLVATELEGEGS